MGQPLTAAKVRAMQHQMSNADCGYAKQGCEAGARAAAEFHPVRVFFVSVGTPSIARVISKQQLLTHSFAHSLTRPCSHSLKAFARSCRAMRTVADFAPFPLPKVGVVREPFQQVNLTDSGGESGGGFRPHMRHSCFWQSLCQPCPHVLRHCRHAAQAQASVKLGRRPPG